MQATESPLKKILLLIKDNFSKIIAVIILFSAFISVLCYRYIFGTNISYSREEWAQFGDFFGGFLGGLSIIAIIYTLIIQQTQLKLQQQEIKEQQKQQKLDSYERMVFWLIDSNQKILDEIYSSKETYDYWDKLPLLDALYYQLRRELSIKDALKNFNEPQSHLINTYCRNLFNALKMMNNRYSVDGISTKKRESTTDIIKHNPEIITEIKEYTSLLRSFIPEKMLFILAVNITNPDSTYEPYKKLVETYALLEHMPFKSYLTEIDTALINELGDAYFSSNESYKKIKPQII